MHVKARTASLGALVRWLPAAAWMGGIFYLSQQSSPLGAAPNEALAIVTHLGLYAVLAVLLFWAIAGSSGNHADPPLWTVIAVTFALAVLYGVSDEVHQAFVAGRTASEMDIAVDAAGALVGLTLAAAAATRHVPRLPSKNTLGHLARDS